MKALKAAPLLAAAAALAGCVLYVFPDEGPWGFESGTLEAPFSTSLVEPWANDGPTAHEGDRSLRSASPGQFVSSTLTMTLGSLDDDKDIHFWVKMSAGYEDTLTFSINGAVEERLYGDGYAADWTEINVWDSDNLRDDEANVLTWTYTRNSDSAVAQNCAWIDDVEIDG